MALTSIHIHEDDWGMRTLHPRQAADEVTRDLDAGADASQRNRAPNGVGWTDVHVIKAPSLSYADIGLTFAAADAALAPIMPRVRKFAASIGAAIGAKERDPYGSYEEDAHCYAHDRGCFIKLDGKDGALSAIWFEARTDADGLAHLFRGLRAIDALAPSIVADYWLDCSGAIADVAFMEAYRRRLGDD